MWNKFFTCLIVFFCGYLFVPIKIFSQNKYVVNVIQPDPIQEPVIITATVSQENKNILEWEQTANENIQYFNIYQSTENTGENWINIGKAMLPGSKSFTDVSSFPNTCSYKYKISTVDKCGNEIFNKRIHKTIKLSVDVLSDSTCLLSWNPYEGFDVAGYNIYRGNNANDLSLINVTTNMATSYFDNGRSEKDAFYQVEAFAINNITEPEKEVIIKYKSRSNIATRLSILNYSNTSDTPKIEIFPNPLTINAIVIFPFDSSQKYQLSILDLTGRIVFFKPVFSGEIVIDRQNLNFGMYILQIAGNKILKKKLMVGRN